MYVYGCNDDWQGSWGKSASGHDLEAMLSTAEPRLAAYTLGNEIMLTIVPRLRKLAKLASPPTCVSIEEYPLLEEWVHESGRLVVIGEAAHPLPVRKIYCVVSNSFSDEILARS